MPAGFETPMFKELDIETINYCNRRCPTCLRNSLRALVPEDVENRFDKVTTLPTHVIFDILHEAAEMGYTGPVNFSHYNEPLMDKRIDKLGFYAQGMGVFSDVTIHTNGDLIEACADRLDGAFTQIHVALYDGDTPGRREQIKRLLPATPIRWVPAEHITTHYSPHPDLLRDITQAQQEPCRRGAQRRMIISFKGDMLLCCEEPFPHVNLGNIHNVTLKYLWYGVQHDEMLRFLNEAGGRAVYDYCWTCPRRNEEND